MNSKIKNLLKRIFYSDLFWIMIVCLTYHNYSFQSNHHYYYNNDTVTYYWAAHNIFKGVIDAARTPVYPALIKIIELLTGDTSFKYLVLLQHVVFVSSIIPIYLIGRKLLRIRVLTIILTLMYGLFPILIFYNNAIFAESLLVSSLVFYAYLIISYIKKPNKRKILLINFGLFALVMLKPVCLVFYIVIAFIWIFRFIYYKKRENLGLIIGSYLIASLLVIGYSGLNKKQNDYFGITTVSHDNKFLNVIYSGAYRHMQNERLIATIDTTEGHYPRIFYLNNYHDLFHKGYDIFPYDCINHYDIGWIYKIPSNNIGFSVSNIAPEVKAVTFTKEYFVFMLKKFSDFKARQIFGVRGWVIYLSISLGIFSFLFQIIIMKEPAVFWGFVVLATSGFLAVFLYAGVNDSTAERVMLPIIPFLLIHLIVFLDQLIFFTYSNIKKGLKTNNMQRLK